VKQEKEEDAIIVKATVGQERKRASKKGKAEKKPKAKKIKQESKGTIQRNLDAWLKKDASLKGILKRQYPSSSRNVCFLFKVDVRKLCQNGNL